MPDGELKATMIRILAGLKTRLTVRPHGGPHHREKRV